MERREIGNGRKKSRHAYCVKRYGDIIVQGGLMYEVGSRLVAKKSAEVK